MTTCARCARSSSISGRTSGRCTGRGTCCSSICGSPSGRSRSATARRARGTWSSACWASRGSAPARWCSPRRRRTCCGGCGGACGGSGALPERLVVDREGCLHAGGGRPTEEFASFCGQLSVGWRILDPGDCQAKGVSERLQGFMETSFEPGRSFCNELDFQDQLDRWFDRARERPAAPHAARAAGRPAGRASARACGRCPSRGRISTGGS